MNGKYENSERQFADFGRPNWFQSIWYISRSSSNYAQKNTNNMLIAILFKVKIKGKLHQHTTMGEIRWNRHASDFVIFWIIDLTIKRVILNVVCWIHIFSYVCFSTLLCECVFHSVFLAWFPLRLRLVWNLCFYFASFSFKCHLISHCFCQHAITAPHIYCWTGKKW